MDYLRWMANLNTELSGTLLFIGSEKLLIDDAIEKLKTKFIPAGTLDLNFAVLDGNTTDFPTIENAVETLPFMSDKKLVIINEIGAYIENKKPDDSFYDYLLTVSSSCILALIEGEVPVMKNGKLYRRLSKEDRAVECGKLSPPDLGEMLSKWLYAANKRMDRITTAYFVNEIGYSNKNLSINLSDVRNELNKIIAHSRGEVITQADVDATLIKAVDANIFKFTNALLTGDISNSLVEFNRLYSSGENEFKILTMIVRQQRLLMQIGLLRKKGYNDANIRDKLGVKPFEFDKLRASRYTRGQIERNLKLLSEIDFKFKSSTVDHKIAMEALIIKMCR